MFYKFAILGLCLTVSVVSAQQGDRIDLGRLQNGRTVSYVRSVGDEWDIEISGGTSPSMIQQKPAQIEIYRDQENVQNLASGYQFVQNENGTIRSLAVQENYSRARIPLPGLTVGKHTLKIRAVDPGVVIDCISLP